MKKLLTLLAMAWALIALAQYSTNPPTQRTNSLAATYTTNAPNARTNSLAITYDTNPPSARAGLTIYPTADWLPRSVLARYRVSGSTNWLVASNRAIFSTVSPATITGLAISNVLAQSVVDLYYLSNCTHLNLNHCSTLTNVSIGGTLPPLTYLTAGYCLLSNSILDTLTLALSNRVVAGSISNGTCHFISNPQTLSATSSNRLYYLDYAYGWNVDY